MARTVSSENGSVLSPTRRTAEAPAEEGEGAKPEPGHQQADAGQRPVQVVGDDGVAQAGGTVQNSAAGIQSSLAPLPAAGQAAGTGLATGITGPVAQVPGQVQGSLGGLPGSVTAGTAPGVQAGQQGGQQQGQQQGQQGGLGGMLGGPLGDLLGGLLGGGRRA